MKSQQEVDLERRREAHAMLAQECQKRAAETVLLRKQMKAKIATIRRQHRTKVAWLRKDMKVLRDQVRTLREGPRINSTIGLIPIECEHIDRLPVPDGVKELMKNVARKTLMNLGQTIGAMELMYLRLKQCAPKIRKRRKKAKR